MNYTEMEAKVRDATNDEAWGPTGQQMQDIANQTFSYESFPEVMGMLWKRMLQDNRTNWRRTYKSLILLHYLVRNGSERVVTSAREHIYDLKTLEKYTFIDETGKDTGINVRHRAKQLVEFIQDDERLREERKKAKKNKDKYIGVAADQMGGFGSFGRSSSSTGGGGGYSDDWNDNKNAIDSQDGEEATEKRYEDSEADSRAKQRSPIQSAPVSASSFPLPPKPTAKIAPKPKSATGGSGGGGGIRLDPAKKIDLGAAATYTGSSGQLAAEPVKPNSDLLADLFDSNVQVSSSESKAVPDDDFADFSSLRSNTAVSPAPAPVVSNQKDEFADFASAFAAPSSAVNIMQSPGSPVTGSGSGHQSELMQLQQKTHSPVSLLSDNLFDSPLRPDSTVSSSQPSSLFDPFVNVTSSSNQFRNNNNDSQDMLSLPITAGITDQQLFSSTLQPTRANATQQPMQNDNRRRDEKATGKTWSDLGPVNIDIDNLLGSKKPEIKLSMNQMASRIAPVSPTQPMTGFVSRSPIPGQRSNQWPN